MSIQTTLDFNTAISYDYDPLLVTFSGGSALLKITTKNIDYNEPFTSDTGFTYDNTKAEFTGGLVRQKNMRPINATCGAAYTTDINLNWGDGVLTGTAVGGASILSGKLDLAHNDLRYVRYASAGNLNNLTTGTVRFKVTPNYSGAPANYQAFFCINNSESAASNSITLWHYVDTSTLQLQINNSTGALIVNANFGSWSPVSGTEYEFECSWDIANGANRLFIDGIQKGTTNTQTGTVTAFQWIKIGTGYANDYTSNFKIDDFMAFSTVQHTTNYTPGYAVSEYVYVANNVTLPEMSHAGPGYIISFDTFSTTQSGSPRYTIQVGRSGNYMYWNGAVWAISDNSYSQANTVTEFNDHVATLDVTSQIYSQFKILFNDSNTLLSSVSDLNANVTVNSYSTANPTIKPFGLITTDGLSAFTSSIIQTGSDTVKFVLEIDGVNKYWTGANWSTSTGYAQSNTYAEINTNASSLDLSAGAEIRPVVYLHSADSTTTPSVDYVTLTYEYFNPADPQPDKCIVNGYLLNSLGIAQASAIIEANPLASGFITDGNYYIVTKKVSATSSSTGYFELELIRSSEYKTAMKYDFKITLSNGEIYYVTNKTIPDLAQVDFNQL